MPWQAFLWKHNFTLISTVQRLRKQTWAKTRQAQGCPLHPIENGCHHPWSVEHQQAGSDVQALPEGAQCTPIGCKCQSLQCVIYCSLLCKHNVCFWKTVSRDLELSNIKESSVYLPNMYFLSHSCCTIHAIGASCCRCHPSRTHYSQLHLLLKTEIGVEHYSTNTGNPAFLFKLYTYLCSAPNNSLSQL